MHKYKVTFLVGFPVMQFESKHHISTMQSMPTPKGTYIHFEDAGIVLELSQVKEMEIDGVKHKMKAYKV